MRKRDGEGLLLKLDFAKAYDNIDWKFLLNMLTEMGFGQRWIKWIQGCVSTATLAVLVNGSPTDFFAIEKGLRQGDPLSPLLFNLCVNALSCMLNLLLAEENPCGFSIVNGLAINHLQFANDTLVFCEDDASQLGRISDALEAFLWASGLKVNF
ncbi:secreted RxLR effector protein 78-like [Lotus japonicus]|uniref:secreted RxLR effector protein 78-like n=1 Tax=Lotus japonicus TaxID=34305 RepID=UPI00258C8341|nr:secreted RxLR effector protein 78-like [Lotus japonicus]